MAAAQQREARVCTWTVDAHPDETTPLKRCGSCRGAWYSSVAAQRAHWPAHKATCRPPDAARVARMPLAAVASAALQQLVGQTPVDEQLALLLRRLRALLDAGEDEDGDVELQLHGAARRLIFQPDTPATAAAQERLWSAPGVASFLLVGDDLRSESARAWRAAFPLGKPSAEACDMLLSPEEAATAAALEEADDARGWARSGAYTFCFLYYNIILAAAVASNSSVASTHDGAGALRSGRMPDAAARRAMALWLDPAVRESCGDAMAPAPSFALTYITARGAAAGPGELAPGVGTAALVSACVGELSEGSAAGRYVRRLLAHVVAHATAERWAQVALPARARLLLELVTALVERSCSEHGSGADPNEGAQTETLLLRLLGAVSGEEGAAGGEEAARWAVWRAAAEGRALCAPGRQADARAFAHSRLLRHAAGGTAPEDAGEALAAWRDARWPRFAPPGDAAAVHKLACYAAVMEPALYDSWAMLFGPQSACERQVIRLCRIETLGSWGETEAGGASRHK
jgi:hypothetical protein